MDDLSLRYYESELRYLREAGKEFARIYPDRAAWLNLERGGTPDPVVERLFEGFAFLTGRLRRKLDDDFPEIVEGLTNLLFPQFLRWVPSLTVVEFSLQPAMLQQDEILPAGFQLLSSAIGPGEICCPYRTLSPVALHPLRISEENNTVDSNGLPCIHLVFELEPHVKRDSVNLSRLRFFLAADVPYAFELYAALIRHVVSIDLICAGQRLDSVPPLYFESTGFTAAENFWPKDDIIFSGYLLLLDYFVFREKFLFVDLCGLVLQRLAATVTRFEIEIRLEPQSLTASLINQSRQVFCLYCVPAVNLFELDAEPIRVNPQVAEYRITPMGYASSPVEIFSVNQVQAFNTRTGLSYNYMPFYCLRHDSTVLKEKTVIPSSPHFYTCVRQDPSGLRETWITLGNRAQEDLTAWDEETLSLSITACHGLLNKNLLTSACVQEMVRAFPGVRSVRNVTELMPPCYPPEHGLYYWQLLSHLSINYLTLLNADVLRQTLALYDWKRDAQTQQHIASIVDVSHRPIHRVECGYLQRGIEISVTLDSGNFSGKGELQLFCTLVHNFFARYADLNLFTKLVVFMLPSGERLEWKATKSTAPAW